MKRVLLMKVTIAVNNYNYSRFLLDCINSVLDQTYRNIEIIIVDDGSTDNSLEILKANYSGSDLVTIVSKQNGGQLSAFNEILKYMTGDIICFLDADDMYKKDYIEKIVQIYQDNKSIDFVYCAMEKFFPDSTKEVMKAYTNDVDIGFSVISALYSQEWIGNPTSAISMRSELLKKILPIPFESDWITRADDCLIWGASLMGGKKYYCSNPLVNYRIHETNYWYGKIFSNDYLFRRELNIKRLFGFFLDKIGFSHNIIELILLEYKSRDTEDYRILRTYIRIIMQSQYGFFKKIKIIFKLFKIYKQKGNKK